MQPEVNAINAAMFLMEVAKGIVAGKTRYLTVQDIENAEDQFNILKKYYSELKQRPNSLPKYTQKQVVEFAEYALDRQHTYPAFLISEWVESRVDATGIEASTSDSE